MLTEEQVLAIVIMATAGAPVIAAGVEALWQRYRARVITDRRRVDAFLRSSWL